MTVAEMSSDEHHPIISLYRNTILGRYRLILVVGREPNDKLPTGYEVGEYKFPERPREGRKKTVPFWDLAYTLIAEAAEQKNMTGARLKRLCDERDSSPMAFADISYRPISSRTRNKEEERRKLTTEDYVAHLQEVASKESVFERVQLVVFSGLTYPFWAAKKYGQAVERISSEWRAVDIASVRFFYGANMEEIRKAFSPHRAKAGAILEEWLHETA
jgi:hypothetical protein